MYQQIYLNGFGWIHPTSRKIVHYLLTSHFVGGWWCFRYLYSSAHFINICTNLLQTPCWKSLLPRFGFTFSRGSLNWIFWVLMLLFFFSLLNGWLPMCLHHKSEKESLVVTIHRHILPRKFFDLIPLSFYLVTLCYGKPFSIGFELKRRLLATCSSPFWSYVPCNEAPCEFYHFVLFNGACLHRLHHLFLSSHHLMFQKLRHQHLWTYASKHSCFAHLMKNHHNPTWSTILLWFSIIKCKLQNFFLFLLCFSKSFFVCEVVSHFVMSFMYLFNVVLRKAHCFS